jgi:hypothetical protein
MLDWGGGGAVMVIVADADLVPSLTDVANTVTFEVLGTEAGAVNVTAAPDAPVVADSEPQPFGVAHETAQLTPFARESFATVAVNSCVVAATTDADVGDTTTEIGCDVEPPFPDEFEPPHPKSPIPIKIIAPNGNGQTRASARIT